MKACLVGATTAMLVCTAPGAAPSAEPAESDVKTQDAITQYGITWTFTQRVEAGQFVTGDWWVVGPVTIDSVTPANSARKRFQI